MLRRSSERVLSLSKGHVLVHHRMTLSALAKTLGGMVNPIWLAVFKLITSSNLSAARLEDRRARGIQEPIADQRYLVITSHSFLFTKQTLRLSALTLR